MRHACGVRPMVTIALKVAAAGGNMILELIPSTLCCRGNAIEKAKPKTQWSKLPSGDDSPSLLISVLFLQ